MMKWFKGNAKNTPVYETRTTEKFLWLPINIEGEVRWLEKAKWEEEVQQFVYAATQMPSGRKWVKTEWVDE